MAGLPQASVFDLCGAEPFCPPPRPRGSLGGEDPDREFARAERLARIVEGEIIPRLMIAQRSAAAQPPENWVLGPETTEKFALYALAPGHDSLMAIIGSLLQRGVSLESIYLDLLSPAARRLGELWVDDRVSFADVTIALGRLQQVVRELSLHGPEHGEPTHTGRSALFTAAPGEQHTFGLVIIEEFFRRSGWRTWTELSGNPDEVVSTAQAHHFDVLGLTVSCDDRLDLCAPLIMSVRQVSRNRDIRVLVGGPLFLGRPDLADKIGADHMAADAKEAVLIAEGAVRQLACR